MSLNHSNDSFLKTCIEEINIKLLIVKWRKIKKQLLLFQLKTSLTWHSISINYILFNYCISFIYLFYGKLLRLLRLYTPVPDHYIFELLGTRYIFTTIIKQTHVAFNMLGTNLPLIKKHQCCT